MLTSNYKMQAMPESHYCMRLAMFVDDVFGFADHFWFVDHYRTYGIKLMNKVLETAKLKSTNKSSRSTRTALHAWDLSFVKVCNSTYSVLLAGHIDI